MPSDSNYSFLFSFWNRIGRSFRLRDDPSTIDFGLRGWDAAKDQRFTGMLWAPLKEDDIASVAAGICRSRVRVP